MPKAFVAGSPSSDCHQVPVGCFNLADEIAVFFQYRIVVVKKYPQTDGLPLVHIYAVYGCGRRENPLLFDRNTVAGGCFCVGMAVVVQRAVRCNAFRHPLPSV